MEALQLRQASVISGAQAALIFALKDFTIGRERPQVAHLVMDKGDGA
jgi:hypothetical protein